MLIKIKGATRAKIRRLSALLVFHLIATAISHIFFATDVLFDNFDGQNLLPGNQEFGGRNFLFGQNGQESRLETARRSVVIQSCQH